MTKLNTLYFDQYGEPSVLKYRSEKRPQPGPDEVVIEVKAAAINPSDVANVAGVFHASLPRVPGRDFAGTIVAGAGREGEEVWGSGPGSGVQRDGAHAQYLVMPSRWVSRKPSNLTMAQASAIGIPYLAAWTALVSAGNIQAGETVLITGVSGAVGRAATQIAHWKKAKVIGASTSQENPSGADKIIDTKRQKLDEEVRMLTDGRGADLILDVVGGELFESCLKSLAKGGRQVAISSNPQVVSFNLVEYFHGLKRLIGVDTMALQGEEIVEVLNRVSEGFQVGALQAPDVQTWSFEDAASAYEAVKRGGKPVKHVLLMP
jgi:NADPH:quinone reductase